MRQRRPARGRVGVEGVRPSVTLGSVRVEVVAGGEALWHRFGRQARQLEVAEWGSRAFSEREMKAQFTAPDGLLCVARERDQLLGFVTAGRGPNRNVAVLFNILIAPQVRHAGLLRRLMEALQKALLSRGYRYLRVDARVSTGFADSLERHYGVHARVTKADHGSPWGLQRTLRIDLAAHHEQRSDRKLSA
jgi:GNAT superfamily N-acetyltransferase